MTFEPTPLDLDKLDPGKLAQLIEHRAWVPLASVAIYLLVRILKSDTKIPIDIPPKARYWAAFALGIASGVLEKVVSAGTYDQKTWTSAVVGGLISGAIAILGHEALIENLRNGRELAIPGLVVPGTRPAPDKPITIPPEAPKDPEKPS